MDVVEAVPFIRKFVADMLVCASNLLQSKWYSMKWKDKICISAINCGGYATSLGHYMDGELEYGVILLLVSIMAWGFSYYGMRREKIYG